MSDNWFYARGSSQSGPMPIEHLKRQLSTDRFPADALVWREGFADWRRVADVEELARRPGPPPLPAAAVIAPEIRGAPIEETKGLGRKALEWAVWAVAASISFVLAKYYWALMLWPGGLGLLSWYVLRKYKVDAVVIPMLAILLGHTGWMIVGHGMLLSSGSATDATYWFAVDLVIVIGVTTWVLIKKSVSSAVAVLLYQIFVFGVGVLDMPATAPVAAQVMHLALRLAGMAAAVYAIFELRKQKRERIAGVN